MNGADMLIDALITEGTDTVFGYPGATVLSVYDALRKNQSSIRHIRTSHEQGSAFAADAYARTTGKTGVCIVTSGPGATNIVTGITNSFMDSVPVVYITGNVERSLIGTDSFQEVDTIGITMSVSKHSYIIENGYDIKHLIHEAFSITQQGRKGPVVIDIPQNVLERVIEDPCLPENTVTKTNKCITDFSNIGKAAELLTSAKAPLILVGGGAERGTCINNIRLIAELLGAPVCCSLMGVSKIAYDDPYFVGNLGKYASPCANKAFRDCDVLLAVGTRLNNRLIASYADKKIIHIDSDIAEINKSTYDMCPVVGDALKATEAILGILKEKCLTKKECRVKKTNIINMDNKGSSSLIPIFEKIKEATGNDVYIVSDVGMHQMITANAYPFSGNARFITSGGLGTMGYGIGAGIGVLEGHPDANVVLIIGDGGFDMSFNELATVKRYALPIIILIANNKSLDMVKNIQKVSYGRKYYQTDNKSTNYTALAKSFGIMACRIRNSDVFYTKFKTALNNRQPAVFEIMLN